MALNFMSQKLHFTRVFECAVPGVTTVTSASKANLEVMALNFMSQKLHFTRVFECAVPGDNRHQRKQGCAALDISRLSRERGPQSPPRGGC